MTDILVVDDEDMIRFAFEEFLRDEKHTPLLAKDAESAMHCIRTYDPEIVFLDYRLPGRDGLSVLTEIKEYDAGIPVVFMTAFGAMDVAIQAMQQGAYEYLTKPLDLTTIRVLIERILEGKRSLAEFVERGREKVADMPRTSLIGKGRAMQEIYKMIGLLTTEDVTVLVTGESGVGKELVARAIHDNSPRKRSPFVAINCGAMPASLLEAEMFGYEKGAFTGAESRKPGKFEVAGSGTIFLDEIGELEPALQVKLLRVLQERTFERVGGNNSISTTARIIAATNRDLYQEVLSGGFRKDLFYRLHLVNIHLPPLRERREDIPLLVDHFVRKNNLNMDRRVRGVTEEAIRRLMAYSWPGNVRELENAIKRAMVISREAVLPAYLFQLDSRDAPAAESTVEDLPAHLAERYVSESFQNHDPAEPLFDRVVGLVEKTLIREALRRCGNNQVHAAQILGMNRSTLRKKRKDYGI